MKKIIKVISVIISLLLITIIFAGCHGQLLKRYYKLLDQIPVECADYVLANEYDIEDTEKTDMIELSIWYKNDSFVEFVFNDEELVIQYQSEGFLLKYAGLEREITDEYLKLRSETYLNIHKIWQKLWKKNKSEDIVDYSRVFTIELFDNRIFIITIGFGFTSEMITQYIGKTPYLLFKYDPITEETLYCGYLYSDFNLNSQRKFIVKKDNEV